MAEPEVLDLTFDSASDDEDRAPPVRAPGYKNHNAPGLREAPEAPRRRSVPTKRYSEEFAPPRDAVKDDDEPPPKPKRRRTKAPAAAPSPPVVIDVDADDDDASSSGSPTSAARSVIDTGVDVHEVDPHWATHNLPGRGCGGRTFHHPTLGAVGRGRGGCSVKCEIVLDRLANVCGGLRRAYEFGYQWHRKPSGDYHQNTFSLPGEKRKHNAGAMIRHIKEIEHSRREELGICFEAWLAGGGYFPPFRSIRAAPPRAAPPAAPGGGHNWGGGRVLGGR